jgi:predicted transcriptional regulator
MPLKFIQVPSIIVTDVERGALIPNDILTYTYLIKATNKAGGKFLLKTESEMAKEIIVNNKPTSTSKVTKSLKRLRDAGHIIKQHSSRYSKTIIITKV